MMTSTQPPGEERFAQLMGYLEHDPDNTALLLDAADAAISARRAEEAVALLDRAAAIAPPGPREHHVAGLAALQQNRFEEAVTRFEALFEGGETAPVVRFNLAWARAMTKDHDGALTLLDEETTDAFGQAAMLEVQLLHDRGDTDTALAHARRALAHHPDHSGLLATISVLAIDVEDRELAAQCAMQAGDHPDALTTLGTLALLDDNATGARTLFDRALAVNPGTPRAFVGRGLTRLLTGETADAPGDLDRGAEMFGNHLGSWIAAGWAHFVAGDRVTSRVRFERALALDPGFAETHGSLAVLDILNGKAAEGRARSLVALRLDRQCYSAALAQALLSAAAGDAARTREIVDAALHTPIGDDGRTIGQALARIGLV